MHIIYVYASLNLVWHAREIHVIPIVGVLYYCLVSLFLHLLKKQS